MRSFDDDVQNGGGKFRLVSSVDRLFSTRLSSLRRDSAAEQVVGELLDYLLALRTDGKSSIRMFDSGVSMEIVDRSLDTAPELDVQAGMEISQYIRISMQKENRRHFLVTTFLSKMQILALDYW